jgi:hypothetical protein
MKKVRETQTNVDAFPNIVDIHERIMLGLYLGLSSLFIRGTVLRFMMVNEEDRKEYLHEIWDAIQGEFFEAFLGKDWK